MGDMLSQAEIDALLRGSSTSDSNDLDTDKGLSSQEADALGEIGNINMGTSATTLFTLLGQKVLITTPKVSVTTWEELSEQYTIPYVAVRVEYTRGLVGSNLLIMQEEDVKIITDLMMGGDGTNTAGELTDLHLSAIGEAMNQMIGSSATSMSSMFDKKIDISPPKSFVIHFSSDSTYHEFNDSEKLVKIAFKMVVGDLIDSEIMQLLPMSFAQSLVENLLKSNEAHSKPGKPEQKNAAPEPQPTVYQQPSQTADSQYRVPPAGMQNPAEYGYNYNEPPRGGRDNYSVQPAQFQSFEDNRMIYEKKNIDLIMDVPLQVTVELGRTHKLIREILEFGQGSIIELDKLAGEPVDILVNGKAIAKGEVVVIDESFGVRITDIIHPSRRL